MAQTKSTAKYVQDLFLFDRPIWQLYRVEHIEASHVTFRECHPLAGATEDLESLGRHIVPDGDLDSRRRPEFRQAKRYFYTPDLPERLQVFPSSRPSAAVAMIAPSQAVCGRP